MKNNPPICLVTYYDKNFEKLGKLCFKSMKKYAKKFNLDIKLYKENPSNRPPAWAKISIVRKLLENYEFVFWIDSDAVFVSFDKDIRKEIEKNKDFYLVKAKVRGKDVPNSGVFLIRNSIWSKKFLDGVWNKKEYLYHNLWENAAIIELLGYGDILVKNKYKNMINGFLHKLGIKVKIIKTLRFFKLNKFIFDIFDKSTEKKKNIKSNGKIIEKVKWLDLNWNSLPGIDMGKKPIIHHYPARPYDYRLEKMTLDLKKNKLIK